MPQNVRGYVSLQPGSLTAARSPAHAPNWFAVPLDYRFSGEPQPRPAAHVREKPWREPHGRLALFRLPATNGAAIEHPLVEVHISATDGGCEGGAADRR